MSKTMFEVVMVNNNSTDNTAQLCKQFIQNNPDINCTYVEETHQGLSYARNRGIDESHGKYVTFADDDALLTETFASKATDYMDSHPEVGEVGGPIKLKFMDEVPTWYNPWMASLLGYFVPSSKEYTMNGKSKKYPRGSNMSFRREIFEKCGNFNVKLGRMGRVLIGGEEKDMAYRILDAGMKISYSPEILVLHLVPKERTTLQFIKNQALGTGQSERLRSKNDGTFLKRIILEAIKWAATIVLWFRYIITLKPTIASTLVKFRFWVSKGLLSSTIR